MKSMSGRVLMGVLCVAVSATLVGAGTASAATGQDTPSGPPSVVSIGGPVDLVPVKAYSARVKCAKVRISDNNAVGYIEGFGTGKTKPDAVAAAKKNANSKVGNGYRAKHCRTL